MDIKSILGRVGALIASKRASTEERDEIPDDVTRDKVLRGMRRQRRIIDEKYEKERLQKEIKEHFKNEEKGSMITPDNQNILKVPYDKGEQYNLLQGSILNSKKKILQGRIEKQKNILKERSGFFVNRKITGNTNALTGTKKKKPTQSGFLGKGNL